MTFKDRILGVFVFNNIDIDVVIVRTYSQLIVLRAIGHAFYPFF